MRIAWFRCWQTLVTPGLAAAFGVAWPALGSTLHVQPDGSDAADGMAWDRAMQTVGRALEQAAAGDEIWVAAGTYAERLKAKPGVALYGGFQGSETTREQRDWTQHFSVLDGSNLGIVIVLEGGGPDMIVDGFTIQRGRGAGVRCFNSGGVLRHNRIRYNQSSSSLSYGAGISVQNQGSKAVTIIDNNFILDNYAFDGGGIGCIDASPQITRNLIAWNTAVQNGGGISCWRDSSPLIAENRIFGNTASWVLDNAAVPVGGGGIFATADDLDGRPHPTAKSSPIIRNNVVAANGAYHGGGISLIDANGGQPTVLNNTIVANNGAGIHWGSSALVPIVPVIINNLIAYNPWGLEQALGTPTNAVLKHNCVFGNRLHQRGGNYRGLPDATGSDGNRSMDPKLANVAFGDLHLDPSSPCVDAGLADADDLGTEDVDAEPRVNGRSVDIGADEWNGPVERSGPRWVRVRSGGSDAADGQTWETAKRTLAAAIDSVRPFGGEIWAAAGTYQEHIDLPAFVHLYGGFSGTETERAQRQPAVHQTVLDGGGVPNVVVSGHGGYQVSTLDGCTIRNGGAYTGGTTFNKYGRGGKGGGILIVASGPVITNNFITRNGLAYDNTTNQFPSYGAGIALDLSYAVIGGNRIEENEILNDFDGSGAGIYCERSMPLIIGNSLSHNRAKFGAALYAWGASPQIVGNTIRSNSMYVVMPLFFGAAEGAVAVHLADDFLIEGNWIEGNTAAAGAGLYLPVFRAGQIRNNVMVGNRAYDPTAYGGMGGGLYCMVTTNVAEPVQIVHNTFVGNSATYSLFGKEEGGGLAFTLVPPAKGLVIANNLIVSNSSGIFQTPTTPMAAATLAHNNLFNLGANYLGLSAGPSDVSRPPRFADAGGRDYRLAMDSADIDAGDATLSTPQDYLGIPRPLDGKGDRQPAPDLGAYEFVHPTADSDGDGLPDSWELSTGLDPLRADADEDPDGDSAANRHEFRAGTDPRDPQSVLALQVDVQGGTALRLRWLALAGRTYDIESCSDLGGDAHWEVEATRTELTDTVATYETHLISGAARYYRVRVK
jgi:hypothetical protein